MNCTCCENYQATFNQEVAQKELEEYKTKGLKKMTRPLVSAFQKLNLTGLSLLDIGGGIGAIDFELLQKGVKSVTLVEISEAYITTFQKEAELRGMKGKVQSVRGDIIDLDSQIKVADVVTLDKVICCYKDYQELVKVTLSKAQKYYAIIIPRDTWWVKLIHYLEGLWKKIKGKDFKTYIHPVREIIQLIEKAGFRQIYSDFQREWLIAVFEKKSLVMVKE